MKIVICIGSSCHLKGSRKVVEAIQNLVSDNNLLDKVELEGAFCMGNCQQGVCVKVDGVLHSVTPSNVDEFFKNEVLAKLS